MPGPTYTIRLRSAEERDALRERGSRWCREVLLRAAGLSTEEPPRAALGRAVREGDGEAAKQLRQVPAAGDDAGTLGET